jgi:hypothetical protein
MEEKKKGRLLEKILLGAVIGGAIGSVIGATIKKKGDKKEPIIEELPARKRSRIMDAIRKITRKKSGLKEIPNEMETEETHDQK